MLKSDKTYHKLLEAGIILFGHNDFSKVSTRDLTRLANVCLGALFYHFGSKENLYINVVQTLTDEISAKFCLINISNFQNLEVEQMQQSITQIIYSFNDLFVSEHGISCTNIFNREAIAGNNSKVAQIIRSFAQVVRNNLNQMLTAYYTKTELPINNIEFIVTLMFSILKNRLVRDSGFYDFNNYENEILKKLITLIMYQKLI